MSDHISRMFIIYINAKLRKREYGSVICKIFGNMFKVSYTPGMVDNSCRTEVSLVTHPVVLENL